MPNPPENASAHRQSPPGISHPNRRQFLKLSAAAAAAAIGSPAGAARIGEPESLSPMRPLGNSMPGRIVLYRDPEMEGHLSIDKDRVEQVVHHGVQLLTGRPTTATAFQSLLPGLTETSTIAIKVNCLGPTDTRWEVVRGVVSGLAQMIDGTYDVSQVTIYDRHDLHAHGYDESEFTFNGHYPLISHTNNAYGSGHYVWENHQLSRYLLEADYVINAPTLKSHNDPYNQITVALKSHYGSCYPPDLCGDIPGMLALNSDTNVKDKTSLVLTSGLRGTYNGGPSEPPQIWNTFPEMTPNTLFISTDPVTNEYWVRDMINAERQAHGWSGKPCPWIEQAGGPPYNLGISDPDRMTVIRLDATDAGGDSGVVLGGVYLAPNAPNPFRERTTLRFRLERPGHTALEILDPAGRLVRRLGAREFPEGYSQVEWDGRDEQGRRVAAGAYFVRLSTGFQQRTRRVILAR